MQKIGDLSIGVKILTDNLQASLKEIEKTASNAGKKIGQSMSKGLQNATEHSKKLAVGLGAVVGALGVGVVTIGKDFETSMGNVSTLINETTESMSDMKKEVLRVGKDSVKPISELTASLYDIRSAGVSAGDAMTVLKSAEMLATAGLSSTKESTDLLTSSFNSFAKQGYDSNEIAEILFKTVKNGKTTVSELAQGFGGIAGLASTVGVDFKELMGATSALTTTGLKSSEVYSGIKGVLSGLLKPTTEAKKKAKELGIEFSITALKTKGLKGFIEDLKEKSGGSSDNLSALFGSVEGLNAVMGLAGANADAFNTALDDMNGKSGALQEAYEKQKQTFEASSQILKNQLSVILIELGSVILPKLASGAVFLAEKISSLINFFKNWDQQSIVLRAGIVGVGTAISLALVPALLSAILAVKAFTVALLANPVTWIIGAIAGAVALLYIAWEKNFLGIRDITEKVFSWISEWFVKIKDLIGWFINDTETAMSALYQVLSDMTGISFESIKLTIEIILQAIGKIFKGFKLLLTGEWGQLWDGIKTTISNALELSKILIKDGLSSMLGFFSGVKAEFIGVVSDTWNSITDTITGAMDRALSYVKNKIQAIKNSLSNIGSSIKSYVGFKNGGLVGFAEGGHTGNGNPNALAGLVHRGEYVIPKNMVNSFPNLISKLEGIRVGGGSSSVNQSRNITVENVNVNDGLDFEDYLGRLTWQLG